jgi:hypothetical protein
MYIRNTRGGNGKPFVDAHNHKVHCDITSSFLVKEILIKQIYLQVKEILIKQVNVQGIWQLIMIIPSKNRS